MKSIVCYIIIQTSNIMKLIDVVLNYKTMAKFPAKNNNHLNYLSFNNCLIECTRKYLQNKLQKIWLNYHLPPIYSRVM